MRLIDEQSEWHIASALFAGREDFARVRSTQTLSTAHFTNPVYRDVFRVCKTEMDEHGPREFSTRRVMERLGKLIGEHEAIRELSQLVNTHMGFCECIQNVRVIEQLLHDALIARGVAWLGEELQKVGDEEGDPLEMLDRLMKQFETKTKLLDHETPSFQSDYFASIEHESSAKSAPFHVGVMCFDEAECLYRGCNALVAAKPGRGKSAIVLQAAASAALRGLKVAYFGAEMPQRDITSRLIQSAVGCTREQSRVPSPDVTEFVGEVDGNLFTFDNRYSRTVADMQATCTQLTSDVGLDLVIVDHIGLIPARGGSRYEQVSQISNDLRVMSGVLEVALITVCQVNRKADGKPTLSSLRDSGRLEEDATSVMFLHASDDDAKLSASPTDVYFAKNRNGPNTEFEGVEFFKPFQQFRFTNRVDFGDF